MHARAFDRKKASKQGRKLQKRNAVSQVPFQTTEIVERQKRKFESNTCFRLEAMGN